jgi:inward rectifier potassium channel
MAQHPREAPGDLGLSGRYAEQNPRRLLNPDGSFNVRRRGGDINFADNAYHLLLTMPWSGFFGLIVGAYLATHLLFGSFYYLCGHRALLGLEQGSEAWRWLQCCFFSVQTWSTVGYGVISPYSIPAHLLVAVEALLGIIGAAMITGLLFARFSRPQADIVFSRQALIAPFQNGHALMFRIANRRLNELTDVSATVVLVRFEANGKRRFWTLRLDRDTVTFFPTHWVIVHPIDTDSPFCGQDEAALQACDMELLILITGMDETFSQSVHVRSSYRKDEIVWGARFVDPTSTQHGQLWLDLDRLSQHEPATIPAPGSK